MEPKVYEYICEECGVAMEEERCPPDKGAPTTCFECGGVAYLNEAQDAVEVGRG